MNALTLAFSLGCLALSGLAVSPSGASERPTAATGVELPADYRDWTAVAPSHRTDRGHIRLMLANETMAKAYREKTLPFPDGSSIAKLVYQAVKSPEWAEAVVPGEPVIVEIMTKDSKKYPDSAGWGFGRFSAAHEPVGDAELYKTCFPCHDANVVNHDFIFTRWAR
ncbi:MAG: cytochrome P460 family protein [Thermodesulfobacteriota bacterium]|jgi:hypothetical protein